MKQKDSPSCTRYSANGPGSLVYNNIDCVCSIFIVNRSHTYISLSLYTSTDQCNVLLVVIAVPEGAVG